jgi:hypothetical protein
MSELEYDVCENCEDPSCKWDCSYERIMFILNVYTKKEQKEMLWAVPKDLLEKVKAKNEEFKARKKSALKK